MNHRTRRIVETLACERRYGIADAKGAEYSGAGSTYQETGADTLNNFKSVAQRIGGTPEQVLMTYLLKHIDSINTTVREAAGYVQPVTEVYGAGEGIVSRLDDARNYLDLLECLLIDNGHIGTHPEGEYEHHVPEHEAPWRKNTPAEGFIVGPLEIKTERTEGSIKQTQAEYDTDTDVILKRAGLVEGLDGVWRGATRIDESVKNPGEKQIPIIAQPTMDQVRDSLETGEL